MIDHLLRDFLYLDVAVMESYLSALQGALFEETIVEKHEKSGEGGGSLGVGPISVGGKKSSLAGTEVTRKAKLTDEASFQRLYASLEAEDSVKYFESFDSESWDSVKRNSVVEIVGQLKFSKIAQLASTVDEFLPLAKIYEAAMGNSLVDEKAAEAIAGIQALRSAQAATSKGIPCVFEPGGRDGYRIVAYLKPQALRVTHTQMVGEMTLFGKVLRKIGETETIELTKLIPDLSGLPLNRAQRRKLETKESAPPGFKDEVEGPAAVVVAIALYQ